MAALQDPDDIYSDPQTIGDDDDDLLADDDLPPEQKREISQTPFLTEKDEADGRGSITELDEGPEGISDVDHEDIDGGLDGYSPVNDQETESADEIDGTE